jgi:hypothetical protein
MRTIIIFIFFLSIGKAIGQPGFNQVYEMNAPASAFHNIIWDGENIVVAGTARIDSLNQWGILFAKFDTLGNLLDQKVYTDSTGDNYSFDKNYSIIHTSDGGYAMTGNLFFNKWGFMAKLDSEGELEFLQKYPDPEANSYHFKKVIELEDGYIISGIKQILDLSLKGFVIKTNFQGEVIWEKKYGNTGLNNGIGSITQLDNNTFIVGSANGHFPFNTPYSYNEDWGQSWIFAIDSLGNTLWEWESEINEEVIILGLVQTDDGGYLYTTGKLHIFDPWTAGTYRKVIKRDSNFNLVSSRNLGSFPGPYNDSYDMKPTPDGNYVTIANLSIISNDTFTIIDNDTIFYSEGWTAGCIHKMSPNGDSIWTVCDTVLENDGYFYSNSSSEFGGMAVLPSGSIIAAGKTIRVGIANPRNLGWLYKVDKNGCIDTLCDLSTALFPLQPKPKEISIYPNPTENLLNIEIPDEFKDPSLQVFNIQGQEVYSNKKILIGDNQIDFSFLTAGIYFIKIIDVKSQLSAIAKFIKK